MSIKCQCMMDPEPCFAHIPPETQSTQGVCGSGAKIDHLGFGQIDSELSLPAEKLQGIELPL